jgi:hypothetical protein
MGDWRTRGSDSRDVGTCFFCNADSAHFNHQLQIDVCSDPQCLEEALRCSDTPTKDLVDIFNEGKEDY